MADKRLLPLLFFIGGTVVTIIGVQSFGWHEFFTSIDNGGYISAFLAGVLYAISFTATAAAVLFADMPPELNPWLVALCGGLGSFVYDTVLFAFFRHESHHAWVDTMKSKLSNRRRLPKWALLPLAGLILASPLPDELAAGMIGFSDTKPWRFMLLTFACDTAGVALITLAF